MKADLVFFVEAPSPERALDVSEAAIREFAAAHPGALVPPVPADSVWQTNLSSMRMKIVVECQSRSEAMSLNNELNALFGKHQRAHSIAAAPLGATVMVAPKETSKKKWWLFSRR